MKLYLCAATVALTFAMPAGAQTLDTNSTASVPLSIGDNSAHAHDFGGVVALGGAFAPKYDGASKYKASPFALVDVKYRGVELDLVGTTLRVNFGGNSHFEYGPVVALSDSRSHSDSVGRVKLLDTVSSSANVGAYAAYRFGGNADGQGRIIVAIQATQDVKSSRGLTVQPTINYVAIRNDRLLLNFDLAAKVNNSKYLRTNFGVTPDEAARSGLAAYRPGGGISQVSGGVTGSYQLTRRWGLMARAQGGTYVGDAGKSPIVKDGSKSFALMALGVSYSF